MNYKMEELIPIVAMLAEKYTVYESTSITYEKAEQLMGAVLYCIHEAQLCGENSFEPIVFTESIPAWQMYETGIRLVEEKVKKALNLYNEMLPEFNSYGNRCLYDTFVKGMPEFFKWYDIRFNPQDTVLTLDYPVRKDLSKYVGIDKIYEFILCIREEQEFLHTFPDGYVRDVLCRYSNEYEDMIENVCEIVLKNRAEAKKMSIYEYDEERHMRQTREEGYEDGYGNGYGHGYNSGFDEGELSGRLKAYREMSISKEEAFEKIMKAYSFSEEKAREMMEKYWTFDTE